MSSGRQALADYAESLRESSVLFWPATCVRNQRNTMLARISIDANGLEVQDGERLIDAINRAGLQLSQVVITRNWARFKLAVDRQP